MKRVLLLLCLTTFFYSLTIKSQGCSDAGLCTVDVFKPHGISEANSLKHEFKIGLNFGQADNNIAVFGQYLEYKHLFSNTFSVNTKITGLAQSGNDISVFGLSDIYLNGNLTINKKTTLSAGLKIPLTDGNTTKDNLPLPMDYQSSLGTFDLILGASYKLKTINLSIAYQQPLSQNSNTFLAFTDQPNSDTFFFTTNNFKRAGDIMLRVSYPIKASDKFKITPSLLPIYHLANDTYTSITGQEVNIENSKGLTLNFNAYFDYRLNDKNNLQLSLGVPTVVRGARPDGLTRLFIANLEYAIRF